MDNDVLTTLARFEAKIEDFTRRLTNLELLTESVHEIAASVKLLTHRQDTIEKSVSNIENDVSELKDKPGKKYDTIVLAIITGLIGTFIGIIGTYFFERPK